MKGLRFSTVVAVTLSTPSLAQSLQGHGGLHQPTGPANRECQSMQTSQGVLELIRPGRGDAKP